MENERQVFFVSGVQQTVVRFCPACGKEVPQGVSAKFCLFCGSRLPVMDGAVSPAQPAPAPAEEQRELQRRQFREELEELRSAAAIEVVTLAAPPTEAAAYYSVIIKKVVDPLRLTQALLPYLARGERAIRLAVEMAPTVLIYKGRKAEVERILPVLAAERACYTVVKGDFERETPARRVLPGFLMLPLEVQEVLARMPAGLWLGEHAAAVLSEGWLEDEAGCLVVTDLHLYFLLNARSDAGEDYRIWPLANIVAQDQWQEKDRHHTDLVLNNKEVLHFSFQQVESACRLKRAVSETVGRKPPI